MNYDAIIEQLRAWADELAGAVATIQIREPSDQALVVRLIGVVQGMRDVADDLQRDSDTAAPRRPPGWPGPVPGD